MTHKPAKRFRKVETGFGVLLSGINGPFLAHAGMGLSPFYTSAHKLAVQFEKALAEIGLKGRVVPVRVTIEVVEGLSNSQKQAHTPKK